MSDIFSALFQPCIDAGIIKPSQLVGYRKGPIYIRSSRHMPPASEQLLDCMEALRDFIADEEDPAVAAVLAHWGIGYIHPFFDGNGRTSRFI
jgi:Fic family protein